MSEDIKNKISSHKKPRFFEEEKISDINEYFIPMSLEKARNEVLNEYKLIYKNLQTLNLG